MSNRNVLSVELIERRSIPEPNSGCWLWLGCDHGAGYGVINVNRRQVFAHRASWMAHFGSIPDGQCVCHRCDIPACVNPVHLFLGSHQENAQDRERKGRRKALRGEETPAAKLSPEQVRAIFSDTRRQYDIADAYGINQGTVSDIKNRKIWKHLWAVA
jgi:hypothetical protein